MPVIEGIVKAIYRTIPDDLENECDKAATLLKEFIFDSNFNVKHPVISPETIKNAKGLVIFTIGKIGISFHFKTGTGILISHLPDGTWSAPSAVKINGIGVGSQLGVEYIEIVMVLKTEEVVNNFCENNNITLGGSLSAAIGGFGRGTEINSTFKNVSAIVSYGKSKGAYFGLCLEGGIIKQNVDINSNVYGKDVSVEKILKGDVDKPKFCDSLYDILEKIEKSCDKNTESKDKKTEENNTEENKTKVENTEENKNEEENTEENKANVENAEENKNEEENTEENKANVENAEENNNEKVNDEENNEEKKNDEENNEEKNTDEVKIEENNVEEIKSKEKSEEHFDENVVLNQEPNRTEG